MGSPFPTSEPGVTGFPDLSLPEAQVPVQTLQPADAVTAATNGALQPAAQPDQVAPLDHASSQRIGEHADVPMMPSVAPFNAPPEIKPDAVSVSKNMRFEFSQALQSGEVSDAQDFAERVAGVAQSVASEQTNTPSTPEDHAQVTNAAQALAGALPSHEDLIDHSIALSHQVYGGATPNSVALIKQNLLDAWVQTGVSPDDLVRTAYSEPDLAARLATPPPVPYQQSPHFPTLDELAAKDPPIYDPLGPIGPLPKGAYLAEPIIPPALREAMGPGILDQQMEYDRQDKELQDKGVGLQARLDQLGVGPLATALGVGGTLGPATAPLRTGMGKMFPTIKSDVADIGRTSIRKETGQSRSDKDIANDIVEQFRPMVNKLMPEHRQFTAEMSKYVQARTQAKAQWVADGNHPDAYQDPPGLQAPPLSAVQTIIDHVEDRPGGGRVAPGSPLYPLVETLQGMMTSVRSEIERHFDIESFVENYLPHVYEDNSAFSQAFGNGRLGTGRNLNRRSIPTLYDAMIRGLTPKFADPLDNVLHYIQGMSDYLAAQRVLRTGQDLNVIRWGRRAGEGNVPEGWVQLRNLERKPEWADKTEAMEKQLRIGTDYDRDIEMANKIEGPLAPKQIGQGNRVGPAEQPEPSQTQAQLGHNAPPEPLQIAGPVEPTQAQQKAGYTRNRGVDKELAWAHPSYARVYNNWAGRGFYDWSEGAGNLVRNTTFAVNASTAMKLGLTGAHLFNIAHATIDSGLVNAFGEMAQGEIFRGLKDMGMTLTVMPRLGADLMKGSRFQSVYLGKAADATAPENQLRKIYIEAGGRALGRGQEMALGNVTTNLFSMLKNGGLNEYLIKKFGLPGAGDLSMWGATKAGAQVLSDVASTLSAPIFDWGIPKLKVAAWANEMETFLRGNKQASEAEIMNHARLTMDAKDDIYGELNSDNVFVPRAVKQMANVALLSQSWWYGTARTFGRGTADILSGKWGSSRARWLLAAPLTYGAIATAYQMIKTGQPPQSALDVVAPRTGGTNPSGTDERARWLNPFKEFEDIFSGIFAATHSSDLPAAMKNVALGYVGGKGSPLVRAAADYFLSEPGQDWHQQVINDVLPIMQEQDYKRGTNIGGFERWLGFNPAARAIADPDALAKMLDAQAKKQNTTKAWRDYYRDRDAEEPQDVPKPPPDFIRGGTGGNTVPRPGASPSGRSPRRHR